MKKRPGSAHFLNKHKTQARIAKRGCNLTSILIKRKRGKHKRKGKAQNRIMREYD